MKEHLQNEVICYWMEKAAESLDSAKSEKAAGRFVFSVNRAYYACFYAASAVLMQLGETFKKHTGVRASVHKRLVKTDLLDVHWGKCYDVLFDNRQRGDYQELIRFSYEETEEFIINAVGFVNAIEELLNRLKEQNSRIDAFK